MRTTVTLDHDVEAMVRQLARERDVSFKEALNGAVRAGVIADRAAKAYKVPSRRLGLRAGVNLDKALQLAGDLEDAEIVHKLELRK